MSPRTIKDRYVLSPNPRCGGMAGVYQAVDLYEKMRTVAVKVFKSGRIDTEILAESFRRETQALKELKHHSIVELFDSGEDENTGEYFLVLEWMEQDLETLLQKNPIEGWDAYWDNIASPILNALAFSHERQYVHRDIKPSNILIDADGKPKLADFGISKLRSYFRPTVTLREFVSRPFAPPEHDDGSYPYIRDVFSFGVLTLKCLTKVNIVDYDSIGRAISEFDAPQDIKNIIEHSVATEPRERQANAEVLLAELNSVQQARSSSQATQTCYFQLTNTALKKLQNELQLPEREIKKIVLEDLNAGCAIAKKDDQTNQKISEQKYTIFGFSYKYLVKAEAGLLVIIDAHSFSNARLEQYRERYWQPPYQFKIIVGKPPNIWEAEEVILELELLIEEQEAKIKQSEEEEKKQGIFRVWSDILRAKLDWEQQREEALKYTNFTIDGNRVIFQLAELPDEYIVGQSWLVKNAKGFSILGGDVEKINQDQLYLYIQYGKPDSLPLWGKLEFDTRLAEIAIERQKNALSAVQYDRAVRSDLREFLVGIKEIETPSLDAEIQLINLDLNKSQKEVVKAALSTQDFLLVQGPPGTGKTTFITEVILQTLQQNPEARILLSSQTHVALDNALERVQKKHPDLKLIRIGNSERVSEGVSSLLLEEQMEKWRNDALSKGKNFLNDWCTNNGISKQELEKVALFQSLKNIERDLSSLRQELESHKLEKENNFPSNNNSINYRQQGKRSIPVQKKEEFQFLEAEIKRLEERAKTLRDEKKQKAKSLQEITKIKTDELLRCSAEELDARSKNLIESSTSNDAQLLEGLINRHLQKLGFSYDIVRLSDLFLEMFNLQQDWFEQFGRNERFNIPLLKRSQVVAGTCVGFPKEILQVEFDLCIVDEVSKATATEVLIPMSRSKRFLLVGDPQQLPPFQDEASRNSGFLKDYGLTTEDIRETLFDHLWGILPDECRKMLTIQHRMVKPIGKLISSCFYEGKLDSNGPNFDEDLIRILPKSVTWLTTSGLQNSREQIANSSFNNACEVKLIFSWLQKLNQVAKEVKKRYSVAVLTGYAAQLRLLNRKLDAQQDSLPALTIECNTVDAFQGREADIVFYSVTRSNREGKMGFLRDEARLNVALSRGRLALVIVGDHQFCKTLGYNPLRQVLKYIEQSREDCILMEPN